LEAAYKRRYHGPRAIDLITKHYARLLLTSFALVPAYLIAYLFFFQNPALKFENHLLHAIAIAAATLEGLFVTYVTWQCYRSLGEPLLCSQTLGFLSFVLLSALETMTMNAVIRNVSECCFATMQPQSR
jgi:two-component system cell cycle response regulator